MPSRILTSAKAGDTSAVITQATVFTIEAATSNSTAITAPGSLAGFVQLETAAATSSPQPSLANGVYVIHRGEGSLVEIPVSIVDEDRRRELKNRLVAWLDRRRAVREHAVIKVG